MAVTVDQFLAALREQESGGNYKVVNSIGAMGAYQVMPANLPSWSKAALGHSISRSEFLSHPEEQDAIARHINGPRLSKYGPAGTAALWYSGQPDPTKTYGNPPVYKYVQSVLALIGKSGTVTGGKNPGATPTDDTSGSTVTTAGLQQAGYDAVIDLTPFGMPLNPFKIPGWLGGKLDGGDGKGGLTGAMWDVLGPALLSALFVAGGIGAILIGLYVTAKPTIDRTAEKVTEVAGGAAELGTLVVAPEAAPLIAGEAAPLMAGAGARVAPSAAAAL